MGFSAQIFISDTLFVIGKMNAQDSSPVLSHFEVDGRDRAKWSRGVALL